MRGGILPSFNRRKGTQGGPRTQGGGKTCLLKRVESHFIEEESRILGKRMGSGGGEPRKRVPLLGILQPR